MIPCQNRKLKDSCDLHFIDGPIELDKSDLPNAEMYDSMFIDSVPRAWYIARSNQKSQNTDCKVLLYVHLKHLNNIIDS